MIHQLFLNTRVAGANLANALSPVRLFHTQRLRGMGAKEAYSAAMPTTRAMGNLANRTPSFRMGEAKTAFKQLGFGGSIKSYFRGEYLDNMVKTGMSRDGRAASRSMYSQITRRNALVRRTALAAVGGATLGTAILGANSLPSSLGESTVAAGVTGLGAFAAMEGGVRMGYPAVGGIVGGAMAAGSLYNMLRTGNQFGPF